MYSREEICAAIEKFLELEMEREDLNQKLQEEKASAYAEVMPTEPEKETATRLYPKVKSEIRWNLKTALLLFAAPLLSMYLIAAFLSFFDGLEWLEAILFFAAFILAFYFPLYYVFTTSRRKKKDVARIKASDWYKDQCASIDDEVEKKYASAMEKYQEEKERIETARKHFEEEKQQRIDELEEKIHVVENALEVAYGQMPVIPLYCHNVSALSFLYDTLTTSMVSLDLALELYGHEVTHQLLNEAILDINDAVDEMMHRESAHHEEMMGHMQRSYMEEAKA